MHVFFEERFHIGFNLSCQSRASCCLLVLAWFFFAGGGESGWTWRPSSLTCRCSFRRQALAPLDTTLEEMRDKLPSSDPSFRYRMKTFMDELLLVRGDIHRFYEVGRLYYLLVSVRVGG